MDYKRASALELRGLQHGALSAMLCISACACARVHTSRSWHGSSMKSGLLYAAEHAASLPELTAAQQLKLKQLTVVSMAQDTKVPP